MDKNSRTEGAVWLGSTMILNSSMLKYRSQLCHLLMTLNKLFMFSEFFLSTKVIVTVPPSTVILIWLDWRKPLS